MIAKISVITPSFQQSCFIERTVQSVLSQGISELEYIVCDGLSTDGSVDILKKYENSLYWVSEKDAGQADAINKGIKQSNGDIIAWINSDDIYYPGALKAIQQVFENYPNVDVVYGDADWIDENDKIICSFPAKPWQYELLKQDCYICQPATFFRRSLVDRYGLLDISLHYCMDYELWLRYGKEVSFYYLPKKLAGSRMYATNKTIGNRLHHHYEVVEMLKNKLGKVPENWLLSYSLVKTEEEHILLKSDPDNVASFMHSLIRNTLQEYGIRKQKPSFKTHTKMLLWRFFPKLAWFMKPNFNGSKIL